MVTKWGDKDLSLVLIQPQVGEDIHYEHLHLLGTLVTLNELNDVECRQQKHFKGHFAIWYFIRSAIKTYINSTHLQH